VSCRKKPVTNPKQYGRSGSSAPTPQSCQTRYIIEYKEYCKESKQKESIDIIIKWLKEINKKYKSD
jgi:hypothetical protein